MKLEEALSGQKSNCVHALGVVDSQSGALASGKQKYSHLAVDNVLISKPFICVLFLK